MRPFRVPTITKPLITLLFGIIGIVAAADNRHFVFHMDRPINTDYGTIT